MIYNVTDKIESESRLNDFMEPGLHDNCEFKHKITDTYPIQYGESAKGKKFAAFHFINSKGRVLIHTEWEPFDVDEAKLANKTENQIKRFKHIITKYVPKSSFEGFTANGFEDFVKKSIQILGNKHVGVKVRLKVTLNNANYTSFPNYTPFIELMSVPKSESVLNINTAMDKMVKDKPDTETSNGVNPFVPQSSRDLALAKADLVPWEQRSDDEMPFS
jgi:hypothetical protein